MRDQPPPPLLYPPRVSVDQRIAAIEQAAIQASCETRLLVSQQAAAFTAASLAPAEESSVPIGGQDTYYSLLGFGTYGYRFTYPM